MRYLGYLAVVVILGLGLTGYILKGPLISTVNQIQVNANNQLVVVGDKTRTFGKSYLKSPYLITLDSNLKQKDNKYSLHRPQARIVK